MKKVLDNYSEIADWNQYEKLKYATLLSASLKVLSLYPTTFRQNNVNSRIF